MDVERGCGRRDVDPDWRYSADRSGCRCFVVGIAPAVVIVRLLQRWQFEPVGADHQPDGRRLFAVQRRDADRAASLAGDPVNALDAATKNNTLMRRRTLWAFRRRRKSTAILGGYLPPTGGALSGPVNISASGNNLNIFPTGATFPTIALFNNASVLEAQVYWNSSGGGTFLTNIIGGSNIQLLTNITTTPGAGGNFIVANGTGYQTGGGSWGSLSDARIKTVDGEYSLGLDAVLALRPVVYRYNGNDSLVKDEPSMHAHAAEQGQQFIGLIAQEAEAVFPGCW